jgi:hypothetical protein
MKFKIALVVVLLLITSNLAIVECAYSQTTSHYGTDSGVNPTAFDLTIYSPDNQTVYTETMPLRFNITWTSFPSFPFSTGPPLKADYAYRIDDGPLITIESKQSTSDQLHIHPAGNFTINPSFSDSLNVSSLENGYHKIVIIVGLYRHSDYYYINQSTTPTMFLVQNPTTSHTPEPTSATIPTIFPTLSHSPIPTNTPDSNITHSPTPSPAITSTPIATASEFITWISILIAVTLSVCVALIIKKKFSRH